MEKEKEEYVNIEDIKTINNLKYDVINGYIKDRYTKDFKVSLGIFLIISSISSGLFVKHYYSTLLTNLTAIIWFVFNIIGIVLIVKAIKAFNIKKYSFPALSIEYRSYLYSEYYLPALREKKKLKTIGIILCACCLLPTMIVNNLSDSLIDLGNGLFLILIATGVFLIKISSSITKAYEYALNIKK